MARAITRRRNRNENELAALKPLRTFLPMTSSRLVFTVVVALRLAFPLAAQSATSVCKS